MRAIHKPLEGFVYFVAVENGGPVKIGWSKEPDGRSRALRNWCPYPAELLACAPGTKLDERATQNKFMHSHIRGEWFKSSPQLSALISEVKETGALPEHCRGNDKTFALVLHRNPLTKFDGAEVKQ